MSDSVGAKKVLEEEIAELRTRLAKGHPHQWYGGITYSQHGEDLIFVDVLHRMGIYRPSYLDVGAHHPLNISNTALLYSRGCRGVNVDAHPFAIAEFKRLRPDDTNLNLGVGEKSSEMTFYFYEGDAAGRSTFSKKAIDELLEMYPQMHPPQEQKIQVVTLDELIDTYCGGVFPDILSLDAEGLDKEILMASSFKSKPKLICVEVQTGQHDHSRVMAEVLQVKGFDPYLKIGGNYLFIERSVKDMASWGIKIA